VLKSPEVEAILFSSADLSRVRVTRTEPGSAKPREITENVQALWEGKEPLANDLWLRDGDVVEVPDKP
jgi:hypothetical protein